MEECRFQYHYIPCGSTGDPGGAIRGRRDRWRRYLEQVQVSCGDQSIPTATVRLRGPDGQVFCDADHGTGPVDAVYRAINRVVGEPNELIEFSIQAVTEGIDAVGRVTIRIRAEEPVTENGVERRVFSGHGAHTDIVVASAKAYMFALNRLIVARLEAAK